MENNFYQDKNVGKFNGLNPEEKNLSVEERKLKLFQLIQEQRDFLLKALEEDEKDELNKILNYQKRENIYDLLQQSYLKKLKKKSFIGPALQQQTNDTSVTVREAEFDNDHELESNSTDFIGPLVQNKNIHAYFLTGDIEPAPDQTKVSVSLENNQILLSLDNSGPTLLSEDSALKSETTAEKDQEEILGLEEVTLGDVKSNLEIKKREENEKEYNTDQKYEKEYKTDQKYEKEYNTDQKYEKEYNTDQKYEKEDNTDQKYEKVMKEVHKAPKVEMDAFKFFSFFLLHRSF